MLEQVKQRDFMAKFKAFKEKEVEIVGRKNVPIGRYIPAKLLNNPEAGIPVSEEKPEDKPKENAEQVDKAAIAQKVLDDFQEKQESLQKPVTAQEETGEIVGNCDCCNRPSQELWTIYEDGEREVCKACIANTVTPQQLPAKLQTLRKVEEIKTAQVRYEGTMRKKATYGNEFYPQPKPVKKKKKKTF